MERYDWLYWTDDAGRGSLVRWDRNSGASQLATPFGWETSARGLDCAAGYALDSYTQITEAEAAKLAVDIGVESPVFGPPPPSPALFQCSVCDGDLVPDHEPSYVQPTWAPFGARGNLYRCPSCEIGYAFSDREGLFVDGNARQDVLDDRLARGVIDDTEYHERL
jgi:hypothetical protein